MWNSVANTRKAGCGVQIYNKILEEILPKRKESKGEKAHVNILTFLMDCESTYWKKPAIQY
jgi:hypothetical protein